MILSTNMVHAVSIDLKISGTVVSTACNIVDPSLIVDLQTLHSRDLESGRPHVVPFQIRLENCDTSLLNSAKVTIRGQGDSKNPALLALDNSSNGKGIAIGFKQGNSGLKDLALNSVSDPQILSQGKSTLEFGAYAEKTGTITPGEFQAIATLDIEYQ